MSLKKMLENFDVKGSIEARIHYYNFRLESEISESRSLLLKII